jgi:uncharacterized protein YcgI (DUF1989 family)
MAITIAIGKLNDAPMSVPDYSELPSASQLDAYTYGVKQYINDGAAQVVLKSREGVRNPLYPDTDAGMARYHADVLAACNVRLEKIKNGTMGVRAAADPIAAAAAAFGMTKAELIATMERESARKRKAA